MDPRRIGRGGICCEELKLPAKSTVLGYTWAFVIMRCVPQIYIYIYIYIYITNINTLFLAYNALHCVLPSYVFILTSFLSLSLSLSLCDLISCTDLLGYLQFPYRPLPFHSPNLFNSLSTSWMPLISLVCVLWLSVRMAQSTLFPSTSPELESQVRLRVGMAWSRDPLQRRNTPTNASLMGPLLSVGSPTSRLRSPSQWLSLLSSLFWPGVRAISYQSN